MRFGIVNKMIVMISLCRVSCKHTASWSSYLTLSIALQLAEGWEVKPCDLLGFLHAKNIVLFFIQQLDDPKHFLTSHQETIGIISVFSEKQRKIISIGSFILAPKYRGHGYGTEVFELLLKKYPDYTLRLISEPRTVRFYERFGFISKEDISACSLTLRVPQESLPGIQRKVNNEEKAAIVTYDKRTMGLDRASLLISLLEEATAAVVLLEKLQTIGFGLVRPYLQDGEARLMLGFKISIIADTADVFERLFGMLANHILAMYGTLAGTNAYCSEATFNLDTPADKVPVLVSRGFKKKDSFPFMERAGRCAAPAGIVPQEWGLLTLEHQ